MNTFVLEGFNDLVFVKTLLEFHFDKFDKNTIPTAYDKNNFKKGINILRRKLLNPKEYNYLKTAFGVIVYGDNGKQTVISKVLPRVVQDVFGKIPEEIRFLIILDEDGVPLPLTLRKIRDEIASRNISNAQIQTPNYTPNEILIVSTANGSYRIRIHVYLVPQSLEKQIVSQGVHFIEVLQEEEHKKLLNDDPHNALEKIANKMGITKEELIKKSVKDSWFNEDSWYINFLGEIEKFFSFEKKRIIL